MENIAETTAFNCYTSLDPSEYHGLLKAINHNYQAEILRFLSAGLKDWLRQDGRGYCIILPGSDGKEERHAQSKTEVILLLEATRSETLDELQTRLAQLAAEMSKQSAGGLPLWEVKIVDVVGRTLPLSSYQHNPSQIYPDRVLNARFLMGDEELYRQARRQVLQEITRPKVREEMAEQLRGYKKAIRTGFFRGQQIFSEERSEQYYSEDNEQMCLGFKMAFLRAVQRKLDLLTAKLIREQKADVDYLAENLPTNTADKIDFFIDNGFLEKSLGQRLQKAYLWFLQQYHYAQETFSQGRKPVSLAFDSRSFATARQAVEDFLAL